MRFYVSHKKGFTLQELLVVAAVISILASIVMVSLNEARKKTRDAQRISDLQQVQLALRQYKDVHGRYPDYPNGVRLSYLQREDADDPTNNGELLRFFSTPVIDPYDTSDPYSPVEPPEQRDSNYYMYIYDSSTICSDGVHSVLIAMTTEVPANANWQADCNSGDVFLDALSGGELSYVIILK